VSQAEHKTDRATPDTTDRYSGGYDSMQWIPGEAATEPGETSGECTGEDPEAATARRNGVPARSSGGVPSEEDDVDGGVRSKLRPATAAAQSKSTKTVAVQSKSTKTAAA
jgi:hypothetical protein